MKCLLCNDWIESVPKLRDLITFNQREEYSCVSCKNQFKKLSKERCQNCNKELHRDTCIDCKLWMKKGYIPKHLAIYRYEENMKDYFSRYKFMGDYCLRKTFQKDIKNNLKPFFKIRNYWQYISFNEMAVLYISKNMRVFAVKLTSTFSLIYIYKFVHSIWIIPVCILIYYIAKFVGSIIALFYISKNGPKHGMLLANNVFIEFV